MGGEVQIVRESGVERKRRRDDRVSDSSMIDALVCFCPFLRISTDHSYPDRLSLSTGPAALHSSLSISPWRLR